jgi:hypothetical protein
MSKFSIKNLPLYMKIWWSVGVLILFIIILKLVLTGSAGILLYIFIFISCTWALVYNKYYKT